MYKKLEPYLMIASSLAVLVSFIGCQEINAPHEANAVLECKDGHLYSIIKNTRYELIEENGCSNGRIELKDK